ncbi:hypothetical protein [Bacteroides acidifaciens]|nr:hypothetical protein [Bacteroides acidifaciens]
MKIRIGKSFDKETNEVFYQLQFKLDGERTYNAYSYDVFKEESDAKEALNKHLNGEREYTYCVSVEKVKSTIKGNRVDVKKVLAFHVMSAKSDLPGSRIWVKIINKRINMNKNKHKKNQLDLIKKAKYNQYLAKLKFCGIGKRNKLTLSYDEFVKKML